MRHALAALALLAVLAPAPAAWASPPPDGAALQRALVGVWCNSADGGRNCWAWDAFRADGSFEACGRTEDDARPFWGRGRYGVEGRRMCYTVTAASANFWLPAGARYCTDIVALDARSHRYRDIDTGAEFTLHRRPPAQRRCPTSRTR